MRSSSWLLPLGFEQEFLQSKLLAGVSMFTCGIGTWMVEEVYFEPGFQDQLEQCVAKYFLRNNNRKRKKEKARNKNNWIWWHIPLILSLWMMRQEDRNPKSSLGYIMSPCLNKSK